MQLPSNVFVCHVAVRTVLHKVKTHIVAVLVVVRCRKLSFIEVIKTPNVGCQTLHVGVIKAE